jgi:hypothetical protein
MVSFPNCVIPVTLGEREAGLVISGAGRRRFSPPGGPWRAIRDNELEASYASLSGREAL